MKITKEDIYRNIINGLVNIPKPKDGKGFDGINAYLYEMKTALALANRIILYDNDEWDDMIESFSQFKEYVKDKTVVPIYWIEIK